MRRSWRDISAGAIAGCAFVVVTLIARLLAGVPTLPDLIQDRLVLLLPGPLFALLLDRFLYVGKPLLFAGLMLAQVLIGAVLGLALGRRRPHPILMAAAGVALWLAIGLLALPLADDGPFAHSVAVALTTLLACAVYVVTLLIFLPPDSATSADANAGRRGGNAARLVERRRLLAGGALALATAVLTRWAIGDLPALPPRGGAAVANGVSGGQASGDTERQAGLPPAITPANRFYVVTKNLLDPSPSAGSWTLRVDGLVAQPLKLSYHDLLALPSVTTQRTLECISNQVGGDLISNGVWTGVRLVDVLQRAGVLQGASAVSFGSADGYTASLTLAQAADPATLIAYQLDGAPLPRKHGYPARVLGTNTFGMKNPKWLTRIQVTSDLRPGFWQTQGWDAQDIVQTMSRIDTPADGAQLPLGAVAVAGIAFAGARGIARVDLSTDGGATWNAAQLLPSLGPNTWSFWQFTWQPALPGNYTLLVRATDGDGNLQSARRTDTFPAGATGYHTIHVHITQTQQGGG